MKGSDPTEEVKEAARGLKELRGALNKVHSFSLPVEESGRHIVVIDKKELRLPSTPVRRVRPAKRRSCKHFAIDLNTVCHAGLPCRDNLC